MTITATDEELEADLARMRDGPSAPPSPSRPAREEHRLLLEASDTLRTRANSRSHYNPNHPSNQIGRVLGRR